VRLEGLLQMKKFDDIIGNGTHDLLAISIASHPTTLNLLFIINIKCTCNFSLLVYDNPINDTW
jgi:hypothetical protein